MATTVDPVCNMTVDESTASRASYQGVTYHFCAPGCKKAFEAEPQKYLAAGDAGHEHHPHHDHVAHHHDHAAHAGQGGHCGRCDH